MNILFTVSNNLFGHFPSNPNHARSVVIARNYRKEFCGFQFKMKACVVIVLLVVLVCLLQHHGCEGQDKKKTTTTTTTWTNKPTKTTSTNKPTKTASANKPTKKTAKVQPYQRKTAKRTNDIRVKHAAPKLAIDENLSEKATKCAKYYADLGKADNSCPHKGNAGENVWMQKGTWTKDEVSKVATESWYDEGKNYDFTKTVPQANTASFTQLVWKKSNKMGFGVAQKNGFSAATALFAPPGNVEGQFADNVKPNKNAKTPAPKPTDSPAAQPAATDPPANSPPAATDPQANSPPAATDPPADPQASVSLSGSAPAGNSKGLDGNRGKGGGPRGGKGR